jgi:hypothetical protein
MRISDTHSGGYEEFYLMGYNGFKSIDVSEKHVSSIFRV